MSDKMSSSMMFNLLSRWCEVCYEKENLPELVDKYNAREVFIGHGRKPFIICKPDYDLLPEFCMNLYTIDSDVIMVTCYNKKEHLRLKQIRLKRRKKKNE